MSSGPFKERMVCPCGKVVDTPWRGNDFFTDESVCPRCGGPKSRFELVALRWVGSGGSWWRPWRWGRGYWENVDGNRKGTI